MDAQRGDDGAQPAGVEFGTAVAGPPVGQVGAGAVDGLGDVAQVLLGVVDVNDLDGAGNCSSARRQIHAAPSPMTTRWAAVSKPRRIASR